MLFYSLSSLLFFLRLVIVYVLVCLYICSVNLLLLTSLFFIFFCCLSANSPLPYSYPFFFFSFLPPASLALSFPWQSLSPSSCSHYTLHFLSILTVFSLAHSHFPLSFVNVPSNTFPLPFFTLTFYICFTVHSPSPCRVSPLSYCQLLIFASYTRQGKVKITR